MSNTRIPRQLIKKTIKRTILIVKHKGFAKLGLHLLSERQKIKSANFHTPRMLKFK